MLNFYKYQVPFVKPFKTSVGEFRQREGIILIYEDGDVTAFGEVSPLPGFSNESLEQAVAVLQHNKEILSKAFEVGDADEIITVIDSIHRFPSVSFGLDTLNLDLKAKRDSVSLSEYLFDEEYEPVPCNTAIGLGSSSDVISQVQNARDQGFKTFKIKVGNNLNEELSALQQIREVYPDIKIRLDANEAWSKAEAIENLKMFAPLDIEYCEQPVSRTNTSELKDVSTETSIPVAADESARSLTDIRKLLDIDACDLFIIKPSLFGLTDHLNVTKRLLNTHNKEVVVTTAFDGVIGRTMTAILAAGLGSEKHAHGLATGSHLKEPINQQEINNGFFEFPSAPGLGDPVDKTNLTLIS